MGRLFTEEAFPWRQSQILPGQLFSSGVQNVDVKQPSQAAAVLNGRHERFQPYRTGRLHGPHGLQSRGLDHLLPADHRKSLIRQGVFDLGDPGVKGLGDQGQDLHRSGNI